MARNRNPRLPKIVVPIPFSAHVLITNLLGKHVQYNTHFTINKRQQKENKPIVKFISSYDISKVFSLQRKLALYKLMAYLRNMPKVAIYVRRYIMTVRNVTI